MRRTPDIFILFYKVLLKAELYFLGTLLVLSSITSTFDKSIVIVEDASAQLIQKVVAQCLKCGDLAIIQTGGQSQQETASDALIGTSTNNIFTTCDSDTPQTGFNAIIDATGLNAGQKETVQKAFAECLTNAPDSPEAQIESLQDISITTTERSEPEIPSLNTLLENPHLKALLENPELDVMIENNDVNTLLEDPNVKALLEDPEVNALLENPAVIAQLEKPN